MHYNAPAQVPIARALVEQILRPTP